MTYQIIQDDILKWTKEYKGEPYHAVFCDPPYHLTSITKRFGKPGSAPAKGGVYRRSSAGFMSQSWDGTDDSGLGIAFRPETWAALSQHLHPGGFIVAFAGTRGYHRMACAMEDSGLIIHPAMVWTFLSGFPKATQISNQIDRAAGVTENEIEWRPIAYPDSDTWGTPNKNDDGTNHNPSSYTKAGNIKDGMRPHKLPATPPAQTWAGHRYGLQALKPALEFIAVAQKPYEGRPVDCITRTGAGAWNIEAGRIGTDDKRSPGFKNPESQGIWGRQAPNENLIDWDNSSGRWPANLLLDEAGGALLDRQSGERPGNNGLTGNEPSEPHKHVYGKRERVPFPGYGDSGGASRMFFQSDWQYEILEQLANADPLKYEPKVSTAEREAGLDNFPLKGNNRYGDFQGTDDHGPKTQEHNKTRNNHPTLKPISLTKYLATLLLPPDAYAPRRICVPFAGTGSEMIGAILAGFEEVVGIESNPDYHAIAEARLAWWSRWPEWGQRNVEKILASTLAKQDEAPQATQLSLLPDEDTQARILKALESRS